jgi:pyruvate/2-oxoglutarate dehydrogenase complex dihydrolipoamide acyltransferase (E2) component
MTDVLFPPLDETRPDTEGVLATWYVADGDQVAEGQLLGEVQVEKVDAEVTAPAAGTVRLLVGEDDVVRQGAPIARIE